MTHATPYPGTRSARRTVALLKAFAGPAGSSSLTQLARRVRLTKGTTFRLLTALESEGMVSREGESGAYRLGPEAIALGWQAVRSSELVQAARPVLEDLARRARETVTLEVLADDAVLVLDEVSGGRRLGSWQSVGTRWPVHATSSGKVLLAFAPPAVRERLLRRSLRRLTPRTRTSAASLRRDLAKVRRTGVAMALEELEAGFAALAAPVFRPDGQVVAAVSIGGPTNRLRPERRRRLTGLLLRHAVKISRNLGFQPGQPG